MRMAHLLRTGTVFTLLSAAALPAGAQQAVDLSAAVQLRDIGPTRQGGRYVDYAVVESKPQIIYAATGSGGLWKSENHGLTWNSIFDNQPTVSLGAIALAPSRPETLYLGTGEANNSRSTYSGDGVYKSTDGGATWKNVGLPNSGHIGRIVVHPTNPDIAYVAALGHLYSENQERGLYMTTDGGATWAKAFDHRVDGRAIGVVDVAMDPSNPQVLYAATYDKVRRPWTFGEGGPGSALFKSTDGGRTWAQLTNGLPTGMIGRIGIGIARSSPSTVYAIIENANADSIPAAERARRMALGFGDCSKGDELYRSDDSGATWRRVAPATDRPIAPGCPGAPPPQAGRGGGGGGGGRGGFGGGNPPYYYGQVRVDPNDKEHVYILSVGVQHTTDGGKTWSSPFNFGGDNHALWIDPADSRHMLLGYDHGMGVTFDGGQNWYHPDNKPLAQFYAVSYDMEMPYNVYGGLQDNGSVKGPSTRRGGGAIPFEDWYRTGGGDGMYNVVDPNDSRWLYNESQFGAIQRVDQLTGTSKGIRYTRPAGGDTLRWNWNAPILISPHNSDVIYHGANVLLRSPFRGERWEEISPDLTVNDPARRNGSGNIQYATITTVDESPIIPGVLWVGTDDGNVQLSRDAGKTWTNLRERIPGHPGYWVSRVIASHHDPAVAYASVTGFRSDDFKPYVWKTTDYGQTWKSVAGDLPNEPINVIREDARNPDLLFAGTDLGLYATIDGGRKWTRMSNGIPRNPVHDIAIHPRDNEIIVGTHGRGLFIGDISPLQEMTPQVLASPAHLFDVQPVVQWIRGQRPEVSSNNYAGESRPNGMAIRYYLRTPAKDVKVRVYDGTRLIAETDGTKTAGVNTVRWTMQARRERTDAERNAAGGGFGGGGFGGGGGGGGGGQQGATTFPAAAGGVLSTVQPGNYTIVLSVDGREYREQAMVLQDVWFTK
ncbi:MAG TPA: hypothetical protein VF035_04690 [Longimicrobiales bacterium]